MKKLFCLLLVACLAAYSIPLLAGAATPAAQTAADALYQLGLFSGTGSDRYGNPIYELDRTPMRTEGVVMLVRLLGKEEEARAGDWYTPFTDVPAWAAPYVGYAYANGLTYGTGDTTFGSTMQVSAAQYLSFVLRALGYQDGTDFTWERASELSDSLGISRGQYGIGSSFTRGDIAIVSQNALSCYQKDGDQILLQILYAEGAIHPQTLNPTPTPAPAATPTPTPVPTPKPTATPTPKPAVTTVYWVPGGSVYHQTKDCPALGRSNPNSIRSGTIAEAERAGKKRACKDCFH